MFKKLIVVFIFIIALNSSCWAGLAFSPVVQLGFQGNDNIDQVPTGSIYDTSLKLGAGFYLDSYLSPDLYLSGGLFQINQKYSNSSYGYTNESNLLLVMEYDLNERLIFGLDNNQISYSDGVIEDNNYNSMICMPRFLFYFTPYTALGVQQENTALK
ncbi:MAG: hypothetical protein KKA19_04500, partial [Candidatus Margulisbacteria bacterium]|nr:hypothetical protein [Candidatus Margulisiibacteriota bacterium]